MKLQQYRQSEIGTVCAIALLACATLLATSAHAAELDARFEAGVSSEGGSTGSMGEVRAQATLLGDPIPDVDITIDQNTSTGSARAEQAGSGRDTDADSDGYGDEMRAEGEIGVGFVTRLKVAGVEVRGWDAEQKAAVRAHLATADAKNDANNFGLFVAMQAIDNEMIADITIREKVEGEAETQVVVTYETTARFLGIIPRTVNAQVTVQGDGQGGITQTRTTLNASWYARVFLWGNTNRAAMEDVATEIHARLAVDAGVSVTE
ncbi:hypothetical protein A3C87_00335 [Candidatus Kaiserbacteria bacterium RIFCSPHIGHO2_02_FULL_49_34]|uniref:Uncharacterized protein n=1 Tax=Candidatus Kaiserbacteria bacterium RIFCSPHIGHO2_02_FULL_49_34 TaxID=1798491 RepID=A0A1F6DK77_9BACT|nr:MAG: hypothetical protein A3C87_00335 [Candidatus Kaiserbacteria bacterium RIFCSPHIGHO2_02_FULL_49_34]